ncbi:MAG: Hsp20/alpha crystallin family protein [Proteobacteria bacterium]|nr:Hsp20/alpha crystallin family protein [Pseudomonadota bacterium]MBU1709670.1 Hsp20/alpha crystallin family protein [Pseudomonadota bacterium]
MEVDWNPQLDLLESDDKITVKAEVPGIEPKDIDISIDRDMLVIKGEKKHEKEESGERYHRVERSFGSFYRAVRLPGEVDRDKIDAKYTNGVLDITLPKVEADRKKITHVKVH